MSDRPRTANYRRCYLTDGQNHDASGGETLQSLIIAASKSVKRPWLRPIGVGDTAHQLLTDLVSKNSCICGEIVFYEAGRKIPLVDVEGDGSTWRDTIHPKDSMGKDRKFQEHSLYFAIRENHVAVIQSVSLNSDDLQSLLAWMLQTKAALVPNALISLQNLPSKAALQKLKDHKIKAIKFGERLFTKIKEETPPDPDRKQPLKRKRYTHRIATSARIVDVLVGLGIAQPIIDKLSKNPDPGAIQVDVEIRYQSRSEKEATAVLQSLASTLGSQDGLDTEIILDGKSSIKGDELTLRGSIIVQHPFGCISSDDALSKLSKWLAEQIRSRKVL